MSDISDKLLTLVDLEQKLHQKKTALTEKRKHEIGLLAEKYNLLTLSDDVWIGLFSEINEMLKTNSSRIEELKKLGARFQQSRKRNSKKFEKSSYSYLSSATEVQTHENT